MQRSVSKDLRKHVGIKLSMEQNEMLRRLADREDRTKIDEIVSLVKRRMRELDAE